MVAPVQDVWVAPARPWSEAPRTGPILDDDTLQKRCVHRRRRLHPRRPGTQWNSVPGVHARARPRTTTATTMTGSVPRPAAPPVHNQELIAFPHHCTTWKRPTTQVRSVLIQCEPLSVLLSTQQRHGGRSLIVRSEGRFARLLSGGEPISQIRHGRRNGPFRSARSDRHGVGRAGSVESSFPGRMSAVAGQADSAGGTRERRTGPAPARRTHGPVAGTPGRLRDWSEPPRPDNHLPTRSLTRL